MNIYSNNDLHTTVLRLLRTTYFPSVVMVLLMFIGACSDRLSLYPDSDSSPRTELSLRPTAQLQVHPLQVESRFYWGATIADFDSDGLLDFFVGGHGNKTKDRIYYRRGEHYIPSGFSFPHGNDRHGCSAGDVNLDGWLDLYCTTGAAKGRGSNPNELWLGLDGEKFERVESDFGAEDPTSRGRLPSFLNFNGDREPDLFVTMWGERNDDEFNSSSIYINLGGQFEKMHTRATGSLGGRCHSIGDINHDGYDDILVCAKSRGGHILLNNKGLGFSRIEPWDRLRVNAWWADAKLADVNRDNVLDFVKLSANGFVEIRLGREASVDFPTIDWRLPTKGIDGPDKTTQSLVYAANMALSDVDRDGFVDLYVARRIGPAKDSLGGDAPDIIIFGPDFSRSSLVPMASSGQAYRVYALENGFLRLNAGPRWLGSVEVVSMGSRHSMTQ